MLLEGHQIDRYRLLRRIGRGGMGEVYLAEDERIGQKVAIKLISIDASENTSTSEKRPLFLHEAMAVAKLDHPNILPLYDYGETIIEGSILSYLVMPFRQEGTLTDWMQQHAHQGQLTPVIVAHFIGQAADALQQAHRQHIIHQDIKPSNFLIRTRKEAPDHPDLLLTDFGIAKFNAPSSSVSQGVRGTPAYMPPEQWKRHPVPASDQYALAIMAYQMLTGQLPFHGRLEQLMRQHFNTQPEPPSKLNPRLPGGIDAVLLHALAKKPEERFASISAFALAFRQAVMQVPSKIKKYEHEPSSSTPETPHVDQQYKEGVRTTPDIGITHIPRQSQGRRVSYKRSRVLLLPGLALLIILTSIVFYTINTSNTYRINKTATFTANEAAPTRTVAAARAHATTAAIATDTAINPNPYPPGSGTLVLNDPLKDNSRGYNWDSYDPKAYLNGSGTFCQFTNGTYLDQEVREQATNDCTAQETDLSDFAFQVNMTIREGDYGGIAFRIDQTNVREYGVLISPDGAYEIDLSVDNLQHLAQGTLSASIFHTGFNRSNLLAVVMRGNTIDLYVNHQHITSIMDSTISHGQIGVSANKTTTVAKTDVVFNDAKVWKL